MAFSACCNRAAIHVESSGKEELTGRNLLVAIFAEVDSPSVAILADNGVTRYDVVSYISHGVAQDGEDDLEPMTEGEDDEGGEAEPVKDPLDKFAVNLNERAKEGLIEPLVGREKEIRRAIQVLARRKKNNPLFVGDAGVSARQPSSKGWPPRSWPARCPRPSARRRSSRWTWAPWWPAPSSEATSRIA